MDGVAAGRGKEAEASSTLDSIWDFASELGMAVDIRRRVFLFSVASFFLYLFFFCSLLGLQMAGYYTTYRRPSNLCCNSI